MNLKLLKSPAGLVFSMMSTSWMRKQAALHRHWAGLIIQPLTFKLLKSSPGGMTFMKGMCLPVRRRYLNTFSSLLSYL